MMPKPSDKTLSVAACKYCQKAYQIATTISHPFCSSRCKMNDLHGWLAETNTIAGRSIDSPPSAASKPIECSTTNYSSQ